MRKFNFVCIDEKTKMQIILSDCSYNNACYYLDSNGFNDGKYKVKIKYDIRTNRYLIYHIDEKENIVGRVFCYDETRGLLLGD